MKNTFVIITALLSSLISVTANKAMAQAEGAKAPPTHDFFVNANVGVFKNFSAFDNSFQLDFGGKAGARVANIEGFSQFWTALAYNYSTSTAGAATAISEIMVQPLFTNVGGSSFYFGPQAGISILTLGSSHYNEFTYGVLVGLTIPISESFSISPEANLTRFTYFGESQTALKLLAGVNYSF